MDTKKFLTYQTVRFHNPAHPEFYNRLFQVTEDSKDISTKVKEMGGTDWVFLTKNLELVDEVKPAPSGAKLTNPKDAIGSTKLALHLVPDTAKAYMALAFTEGALKYGSSNWRVAGVRASIYKSAAERHLAKYWNGEWADPVTGVPHLASVMACAAIILDANLVGKLTDDRPPAAPMAGLIDGLEPVIKNLQEMFKDHNPKHHTELDMPQ